jgi:hypothetical protein
MVRRISGSGFALAILITALGLGGAAVLRAQLEGSERGVAPIDSTSNFEVGGITVDVAAKNADAARIAGWREAQRKGWRMLWAKMHGGNAAGAPGLSDSALDAIVAGIVVEQEQIGPTRYVARLGILFDRARTGQLLGVTGGQALRSAPMLTIPVMVAGGTPVSFELRNEWQRAWARFRAGQSPIDYVRPVGTGADPLLLNMAQSRRPGRGWWRMLIDQYGTADVLVPEVYLERSWPGGPITGRFVARRGPDARVVEQFSLTATNSQGLTAMLDEGVRRIDAAYIQALQMGVLAIDPALIPEEPPIEELPEPSKNTTIDDAVDQAIEQAAPVIRNITVQVITPDADALAAAEATLRGIPGSQSVSTSSLALGGISVLRVNYGGELDALALALSARGWRVETGQGALRIAR